MLLLSVLRHASILYAIISIIFSPLNAATMALFAMSYVIIIYAACFIPPLPLLILIFAIRCDCCRRFVDAAERFRY